jgi:glucose/arabinose dehydrogenase
MNVSRIVIGISWILGTVICIPVTAADPPQIPALLTEATPAAAIEIRAGFRVERLHSLPKGSGSLIAMCFDDRGRLFASEQGPRLFVIQPPALGSTTPSACQIEELSIDGLNPDPQPPLFGMVQGMAFVKGALYVVQHGDLTRDRFRPDAIVRLTDSNQDGRLDRFERLFEFPAEPDENVGWHEHAVHGIRPAPDGQSLYVIAGDRSRLPTSRSRTPRHWNRDQWGQQYQSEPFAGGWVMRIDLDGKNPEVISLGLRNSYDLAFNQYGDLFTFDSDLEYTVGMPNYRPTAIRQIRSGTESGWGGRAGAMDWSWPARWEDVQPPLRNIGPGSPTGVCFGDHARFPAKYQRALFACDWSYGRMFAIHLQPEGASYRAEFETFLSAAGLPITDLAVSPLDGALYFITGGRGTQSGVYRVTYAGDQSTAPASLPPLSADVAKARAELQRLEAWHGATDSGDLEIIWPALAHRDRAIRGAARIALEWQAVSRWEERAWAETEPRRALQALLALARSTDGRPDIQPRLLQALEQIDLARLTPEEIGWYVRIVTISAIRHGMYATEASASLARRLELLLPTTDRGVNLDLAAACAALGSSGFIAPTLDLLEHAETQAEQIGYLQALLQAAAPGAWTADQRKRLARLALSRGPFWKGGAYVKPARDQILKSTVALLTDGERTEFATQIAESQKPAGVMPAITRPLVKNWKLEELLPALQSDWRAGRDLPSGRRLFLATNCIYCHSFGGEGGVGGPRPDQCRSPVSSRRSARSYSESEQDHQRTARPEHVYAERWQTDHRPVGKYVPGIAVCGEQSPRSGWLGSSF